jgi:hypothetical protein
VRNRNDPLGSSINELDAQQSATLRDRLMREIADLTSADAAAQWALAALAAKNQLPASDATLIEDTFAHKMSTIAATSSEDARSSASTAEAVDSAVTGAVELRQRRRIDKSVLKFGELRRYRSKAHLRFVAQHPCLICGRKPSDPHHLRYMQPRGLGLKVSDEFTVPLCRVHHRAVHQTGNEAGWWKAIGIDPTTTAHRLWCETRGTQSPEPERTPSLRRPHVQPELQAAETPLPGPIAPSPSIGPHRPESFGQAQPDELDRTTAST